MHWGEKRLSKRLWCNISISEISQCFPHLVFTEESKAEMKGCDATLQRGEFLPSALILPLPRGTGTIEGAQQCAIRAAVGWEDVTVEQMKLEISLYNHGGKRRRLNWGCCENAFLRIIFFRGKKAIFTLFAFDETGI